MQLPTTDGPGQQSPSNIGVENNTNNVSSSGFVLFIKKLWHSVFITEEMRNLAITFSHLEVENNDTEITRLLVTHLNGTGGQVGYKPENDWLPIAPVRYRYMRELLNYIAETRQTHHDDPDRIGNLVNSIIQGIEDEWIPTGRLLACLKQFRTELRNLGLRSIPLAIVSVQSPELSHPPVPPEPEVLSISPSQDNSTVTEPSNIYGKFLVIINDLQDELDKITDNYQELLAQSTVLIQENQQLKLVLDDLSSEHEQLAQELKKTRDALSEKDDILEQNETVMHNMCEKITQLSIQNKDKPKQNKTTTNTEQKFNETIAALKLKSNN